MKNEQNIRCVVSGSFSKFKPEIDKTIDCLTNTGVAVLAPDKGWLSTPQTKLYKLTDTQFRPLPTETHMTIRQIEDTFLKALSRSHFLYVVNPNGYVGLSTCLEIGFAFALAIPVYALQHISPQLDTDLLWQQRVAQISILSPHDTATSLSHSYKKTEANIQQN